MKEKDRKTERQKGRNKEKKQIINFKWIAGKGKMKHSNELLMDSHLLLSANTNRLIENEDTDD